MYQQHNHIATSNLFQPPEYVEQYQGYIEPLLQEKEKKGGRVKKSKTAWQLTPERKSEFKEARDFLYDLVYDKDVLPLDVARAYIEAWPDTEAEPLRNSPNDERQTAWCKFNRTTRPAFRLFGCLDQPHFYTLHADHLGLTEYYGDAENFQFYSYDTELREVWKQAISQHFAGQTYFYKFENANRFHVHLIASHNAGLNHLTRQGEVIKRIKPGTEEKTLAYLCKPHATYNEINLAMWVHAKRDVINHPNLITGTTKNLPRVCGYIGLEPVKVWNA